MRAQVQLPKKLLMMLIVFLIHLCSQTQFFLSSHKLIFMKMRFWTLKKSWQIKENTFLQISLQKSGLNWVKKYGLE